VGCANKKEIKDGCPKMVCHMLIEHVEKKRKTHTQRRYATCPQGMSKKRERKEEKKIAHIQEK